MSLFKARDWWSTIEYIHIQSTCTCTHTHNHIHILYTYIHTYTYIYTYTYMYTFTYMSFMNMHAQTRTHTHTHTHTHTPQVYINPSVCAMAHVTHTKLGTKVEYHSKEEDAEHGKRRLKVCDSLPSPASLPFLPTLSHAIQAMVLSVTNSNRLVQF